MGYKTEPHRHRQTTAWWLPEDRGWEGIVEGKGGQIYGDRWFNLGWWAHNAIYRSCIIEVFTWNLYYYMNRFHPNSFNLKNEWKWPSTLSLLFLNRLVIMIVSLFWVQVLYLCFPFFLIPSCLLLGQAVLDYFSSRLLYIKRKAWLF